MPLFICDVCSSIENTALSAYDFADTLRWKDASLNGKHLCSECTPPVTEDGRVHGYCEGGVWHGKFPKEIATEEIVLAMRPGPPDYIDLIYLGPFEYLRERFEETENPAP